MAFEPLTEEEIQPDRFAKNEVFEKIRNDLNYLYEQMNPGFSLRNPQFELDVDADGIPDGWTVSYYPGGSGGFEIANPLFGAKSWKFIHPGGSGNGGGYLESDYIPCGWGAVLPLSLMINATASALVVKVQVRFYDKALAFILSRDMYAPANAPTIPTRVNISGTIAPNDARFVKYRLVGGDPANATAGYVRFDDLRPVSVAPGEFMWPDVIDQAECNATTTTFVDIGAAHVINIPSEGVGTLRIRIEGKGQGTLRARIGATYSNEVVVNQVNYGHFVLDLPLAALSGQQTLRFQGLAVESSVVYLKSPAATNEKSYLHQVITITP